LAGQGAAGQVGVHSFSFRHLRQGPASTAYSFSRQRLPPAISFSSLHHHSPSIGVGPAPGLDAVDGVEELLGDGPDGSAAEGVALAFPLHGADRGDGGGGAGTEGFIGGAFGGVLAEAEHALEFERRENHFDSEHFHGDSHDGVASYALEDRGGVGDVELAALDHREVGAADFLDVDAVVVEVEDVGKAFVLGFVGGQEAGCIVAGCFDPAGTASRGALEGVVSFYGDSRHAFKIDSDRLDIDDKHGCVGRGGLQCFSDSEQHRADIERAFFGRRDVVAVSLDDFCHGFDEEVLGHGRHHEALGAPGESCGIRFGPEEANFAIDPPAGFHAFKYGLSVVERACLGWYTQYSCFHYRAWFKNTIGPGDTASHVWSYRYRKTELAPVQRC